MPLAYLGVAVLGLLALVLTVAYLPRLVVVECLPLPSDLLAFLALAVNLVLVVFGTELQLLPIEERYFLTKSKYVGDALP